MCFIDDQDGLATISQLSQRFQIRSVTIHAVQTFYRDPNSPPPPALPPSQNLFVNRLQVIVTCSDSLGAAAAHAVMDAGVNPLIVHDEIATLWGGGEQGLIGSVPATEVQRRFNAEEIGSRPLQRLVFRVIAA